MSKRYEWINGETYCDSDQMYDNETGNKTQPVYVADLLNEQDQKIKELEHRLANCIDLPIPIGEKCWTINCYKTYGDVKKGEPYYATRYELHENIVSGYDIYKSMINDKLTLNVVPRAKTNYIGVQPYLFATETEARKKLEEMKGE